MNVGQKVKVCRIRYRNSEEVTAEASKKLGQIGTVQAYQMVDGSGFGLKLAFDDNSTIWFFDNEVESVR